MLVLSREEDESIIIGDAIEIRIVRIEGKVVRIGIKAPRELSVHRKEVYDAIYQTNQQSVKSSHIPSLKAVAKQIRKV